MHYSEGHLYIHSKHQGLSKHWTLAISVDLYKCYLEEDKDKKGFLVLAPLTFMEWVDTEEEM